MKKKFVILDSISLNCFNSLMINNCPLEILINIIEYLPFITIVHILKTNRFLYESCKNLYIKQIMLDKMGIEYPLKSTKYQVRAGSIFIRQSQIFKIPYNSKYIIVDMMNIKEDNDHYKNLAKVRRVRYIKDGKVYCNRNSSEFIINESVDNNHDMIYGWHFMTNRNEARFIFL